MINITPSGIKGFTLVETMVAISILMFAILGPLTIASAGLRNSAYARDQITAYYLAQEGVEYVRYIRDNNYIENERGNGNGWLSGLENCTAGSLGDFGCALDSVAWFDGGEALIPCQTESCDSDSDPKMYVTPEGYYSYDPSGNSAARYKRVIKVIPIGVDNSEAQVVSTMTWNTTAGGEKTFKLTENLFNLYNN